MRLIGFLWSLLESYSLLLLEEPELSLNTGIIKKLLSLMNTVLRNKKRKSQVMISTHSAELLSDVGIGGEEVIILIPKPEGTVVEKASSNQQINVLLSEGFSVAEAVLPHAEPSNIYQLSFLDEL